jgi:hypothetical protein
MQREGWEEHFPSNTQRRSKLKKKIAGKITRADLTQTTSGV